MTDYLDWQSSLSLETVFAGTEKPEFPQFWNDGVLFLQPLKAEQGRMVLMLRRGDVDTCLTPPPFNLRTRVSEYGGKPYWLDQDVLYFVNQADQCLYRQCLTREALTSESTTSESIAADVNPGVPERVSPSPDRTHLLMYADLRCLSPSRLLAIVEQEHTGPTQHYENRSFIAALDLQQIESDPKVLVEGADFYSNLCVDPEAKRLAWVQWNHPNMPWDETELWVADLENHHHEKRDHENKDNRIGLRNPRRITLQESASVCQLLFANNGRLFFSADFSGADSQSSRNFWNIYAVDTGQSDAPVVQVTQGRQEFGYPHWQYGDARIARLDANTLLSFASDVNGDVLYSIDQDSLAVQELAAPGYGYQNLSATGTGRAAVIMLSDKALPSIAVLEPGQEQFRYLSAPPVPLQDADISVAQHFEFPTRDGASAFGYYYAPCNAAYPTAAAEAEPPPLIVMVHGGPTARAYGFFDIQKQFWTQRGFAIFDVNHRGSNGYGRAYRDALYGDWGEIDASDIVDGVETLIAQGKAAPDKVCIRGKSAGGYAVLRALTEYPQVFRAGACYYGIGNLVTLAETTHKFEKHYADRMIGETFDKDNALSPASRFYQRSPINRIGQVRSAMIVFQGLQDKIVPPAVANEVIDALKRLGLEHSYVEYADEGHGFRQAYNNIDAWTRELQFYRANLK